MAGFSGRRRWTESAKRRIVAESEVPGATISAVARRHGLSPGQLSNWRRGLASAEGMAPALSGFVPVVVDAGPDVPAPAAVSVIEIVVGPVTVRLDGATNAAVLHRVLEAALRLA